MIIALILNLIVLLLSLLFSFLPVVTELPLGLDSSLNTVYGLYHGAVTMLPFLGIAMNYVLLAISIEIGYKSYQVLMRFVKLVRGSG